MSTHVLGMALGLRVYAFFLGVALIALAITDEAEGAAAAKAFTLGLLILSGAVGAALTFGDKTDQVALPLLANIAIALLGVWTGLQLWGLMQPAATRNHRPKP